MRYSQIGQLVLALQLIGALVSPWNEVSGQTPGSPVAVTGRLPPVLIPKRIEDLQATCARSTKFLLEKNHEFYATAAELLPDGMIQLAGYYNGNEHPEKAEYGEEFLELLRTKIRDGKVASFAFAIDVRATHPTTKIKSDAICVQVERSDGSAITWFYPYEIKGTTVEYGETWRMDGPAIPMKPKDNR